MSGLKTMPVSPEYLRASVQGRPVGIDRNKDMLMGYVVAQEGPFKSDGRGEFDELSLRQIIQIGNAARGGLKSRFTHPDMSSDGLGKFLGRSKDFSMSTATDARTGRTVKAVRGDLHFDPSSHETPNGDLAKYVMDLAESDPDAISSSLVVKPKEEYRLNKDGTRERDTNDNPLPPLWRIEELHASDIVDIGDAVDGLLSASLSAQQLTTALTGGMTPELLASLKFDNVVRLGGQLLDGLFAGQPREVVEARCKAYFERYLARKFSGEPIPSLATPRLDAQAARLARLTGAAGKVKPKA